MKEKENEEVKEEVKEETTAEEAEAKAADEATGAEDAEKASDDASQVDAKAVEAAVADMKNRYLRLQADFANFKRRSEAEKQQMAGIVKMDVLANVLPVIDNFERALQTPQDGVADDVKSFIEGYAMIYKQLVAFLEKEGVTKIDAVGKPFDPNYHQAVMRVASDEYENDTVVEVLQAGYLLGDKTLRPAMVKVAFNG